MTWIDSHDELCRQFAELMSERGYRWMLNGQESHWDKAALHLARIEGAISEFVRHMPDIRCWRPGESAFLADVKHSPSASLHNISITIPALRSYEEWSAKEELPVWIAGHSITNGWRMLSLDEIKDSLGRNGSKLDKHGRGHSYVVVGTMYGQTLDEFCTPKQASLW